MLKTLKLIALLFHFVAIYSTVLIVWFAIPEMLAELRVGHQVQRSMLFDIGVELEMRGIDFDWIIRTNPEPPKEEDLDRVAARLRERHRLGCN